MIYALALFVFILSWILPWWGFCAISFLFGHKMKSALGAFATAFGAVFFVWLAQCYLQNVRSHGLMAAKMSELFGLPNPMLILVISSLMGGLMAGLWCVSGYYLHQLRSSGRAPKPVLD